MTKATYTAELETTIGARGSTRVDSGNRGDVRRWLCARGVDSPRARKLTIDELARAYNDTSNTTLGQLLDAENASLFDTPAPRSVGNRVADNTDSDDADALELARMLTRLRGSKAAPLDESRVVELINEHARKTTTLHVKTDVQTNRVDGAQHAKLPALIMVLAAGCNVWLAGPSGSGKTHMTHQAAQALGRAFYSTGAVTSDFRLMGFIDAKGEAVRTPFRDAFEHGGVFLWDEIDASNPNALVAFNQALANNSYAFPDAMVDRHPDFIAIAAANTYGHGPTAEYVGRNRIDGATLDRFTMLDIDYDAELERSIAGDDEWVQRVQRARAACAEHGIQHIISPRASVAGARLLAAGMDINDVARATVRKSLSAQSWQRVAQAMGVQA